MLMYVRVSPLFRPVADGPPGAAAPGLLVAERTLLLRPDGVFESLMAVRRLDDISARSSPRGHIMETQTADSNQALVVSHTHQRRSYMKRSKPLLTFFCALLLTAVFAAGSKRLAQASAPGPTPQASPQAGQPGGDRFMYADFESLQDNRPVSSRGGFV